MDGDMIFVFLLAVTTAGITFSYLKKVNRFFYKSNGDIAQLLYYNAEQQIIAVNGYNIFSGVQFTSLDSLEGYRTITVKEYALLKGLKPPKVSVHELKNTTGKPFEVPQPVLKQPVNTIQFESKPKKTEKKNFGSIAGSLEGRKLVKTGANTYEVVNF